MHILHVRWCLPKDVCCFFVRKYLNDKHQKVSLTRQAESVSETQIIEEKPQCNHFQVARKSSARLK